MDREEVIALLRHRMPAVAHAKLFVQFSLYTPRKNVAGCINDIEFL